jgi:hypothetical protein
LENIGVLREALPLGALIKEERAIVPGRPTVALSMR